VVALQGRLGGGGRGSAPGMKMHMGGADAAGGGGGGGQWDDEE
jgi:hypothetical protein